MLTTIDKKELPMLGNRAKSELRVFAEETIAEFLENSKAGEIAEVTEAPLKETSPSEASRLVNALRAAGYHADRHAEVHQFRRGGRVFLERKKVPACRKPNPYPFD